MPLGERSGDKESRYCGVETEFSDDVPQLLAYNLSSSSFDFVLAPLVRNHHSFLSFLSFMLLILFSSAHKDRYIAFCVLVFVLWWPISQSHSSLMAVHFLCEWSVSSPKAMFSLLVAFDTEASEL